MRILILSPKSARNPEAQDSKPNDAGESPERKSSPDGLESINSSFCMLTVTRPDMISLQHKYDAFGTARSTAKSALVAQQAR